MKRKKKIINLLLILYVCVSCRQEADYIAPSGYPNTHEGNFDAFWNGIDQNYVFFNYDPIDWDSMYAVYRPLINRDTSALYLARVCASMMSQLIDGHKMLTTTFGDYSTVNSDYVKKHPEYYYFDTLLLSNYVNDFLRIEGKVHSTDNNTVEIMSQNLKDYPIYFIRFNFFGNALQNNDQVKKLDSALIANHNSSRNGIILDLRHNFGGSASEFYTLLSKFVTSDYNWGYSQTRLQRDRYTLSPFVPEIVKPDGYVYYGKRIVVLTNRYSFSASEITTMAMRNLPNVIVIGDTTGGANGPVDDIYKDFTGNFPMPNGWTIQLAQRVTLDANKNIFEGKGVPPDLFVKQDKTAYEAGRDNVLEFAINYLSNK